MTYDIESIVIKVLANDSGNLVIPLKGYSTSGNINCPYDWKISVDDGAETSYSGTGGGTLTIATGLVPGSEHLVIIKPTTVDYQWARAFGTDGDTSIAKYITEIVQDASYIGYGISATNTGGYFKAYEYQGTKITKALDEYLPDTVTTLGIYYLSGLYSDTLITKCAEEYLPSGITSIPNEFRSYMYGGCNLLKTTTKEVLPESVTTIGNYFRSMQYIYSGLLKTEHEYMPESITQIGTYCRYNQYSGCPSLEEIVGEKEVKNAVIGNRYRYAQYYNSPNIKKARLAAQTGLTQYCRYFSQLTSPATITILGDVLDDCSWINSQNLGNSSVYKIYVDSSLVSAYKNNNGWSNIDDDKFVEIPYIDGTIERMYSIGANIEKQELKEGKVSRYVSELILNGTENWSRDSGTNTAYLGVTGSRPTLSITLLCTHSIGGVNEWYFNNSSLYCKTEYNDLQSFKDWLVQEYLDNTPVIVLYPLYSAQSITVTPIAVATQNGENLIEITQGGPDVNDLQAQIVVEQATGGYTANVFNGEDYSDESNWTEISEQEAGLTAGENITIENNVISAKDTTYTAGDNVTIDNNEISVDLDGYQTIDNMVQNLDGADHSHYPTAKAVKDAIVSGGGGDVSGPSSSVDGNVVLFDGTTGKIIKDSGVSLSDKQDTLTAGNGIGIDANNKISTTFIYGESSTAAATVQKEVSIPSITELNVGQVIHVKPSITSTVANATLKLNDFEAYPMRYSDTAISTTTDAYTWRANTITTFLFDGTYWQVASTGYDVNSTYTLHTLLDSGKYTAGTGTYALSRYSLVMEKGDGTWEKITNTSESYTTATTKTVNTNGFKLNHIRYYNTTTNVATGALIATSTLANQISTIDLRYSTNCGGTTTWAEGDYIYLVGTIKADGLFYLDTTQWWTNQLPGSNDGKLYIRIGLCLAANGYTASFLADRPIYYYDNGIKIYQQADNKQDVISDLTTIRSGAELGATAIQPNDNISELTNDVGYITSAPVTSVNNQTGDVVLTIPTTASDVGALPNTTKYGAALTLEVNSSTYVVTATLKDQDGNTLGTAQTIDLPLESVVVGGSYDDTTKKVILTLQSGSTVEFSVADLVTGLQSEITSTNKLSSDLVDDTNHTNKFVTAAEKTKLSNLSGTNTGDETGTTIKTKLGAASASQDGYLTSTDWSTFNSKQNAISDLATIRSGAEAGATALQPGDNISVLSNDAGYLTSSTGVTSVNGQIGAVITNDVCTWNGYDALPSTKYSDNAIYFIKK